MFVNYNASTRAEFEMLEDRIGKFAKSYDVRGDSPIQVSLISGEYLSISPPRGGKITAVVPTTKKPSGSLICATDDSVELLLESTKYCIRYTPFK